MRHCFACARTADDGRLCGAAQGSPSAKLLMDIQDSFVLVNIVDNDFIKVKRPVPLPLAR
jgi:hypothetical protein